MLSIIVAMTEEGVIGKDNSLPWHIPEDLKLFKEVTKGHAVLMGRKTYESIVARLGRSLPDRRNIVLSTTMQEQDGVEVVRSLDDALKLSDDLYVIGGASLYKAALPIADRLYISWIKDSIPGDTHFPDFSRDDWKEIESKKYDRFTHKVYLHNNNP